MKKGLIYAFTGEGKGKTSAALGVSLRMLCLKRRVVWISWYKEKAWNISEMGLEKIKGISGNLQMFWVGKGFYLPEGKKEVRVGLVGRVIDKVSKGEHMMAAENGMNLAIRLLREKIDLIVLDEVLNAVADGLVEEKQLIDLLELREDVHVVITGRGLSKKLEGVCDLVSEVRKVKHPYDKGLLAVKGLDY